MYYHNKKLPLIGKMNVYKANWTNHVNRMLHRRFPRTFKKYITQKAENIEENYGRG